MSLRVLAVAPGPERHGVVVHALAVGRLLSRAGAQVTVTRDLDPVPGAHDLTWVQFTDRLFGADVDAAAGAFVAWAATAARPLTSRAAPAASGTGAWMAVIGWVLRNAGESRTVDAARATMERVWSGGSS